MFFKALGLAALVAISSVAGARAQDDEQSLIDRGGYLARAGDCVACHTAPGGKPFAGGLAIKSDLGDIYSTNITPDKEHGIGNYTQEQFAAAVRDGIRADGAHLYPAMPYMAYGKVTDDDIHALYAYFMKGVTAEADTPPETALGFPYNQRWGMWFWNLFFAPSSDFRKAADQGDPHGRGAYLVEGLGHCGACHTPRGFAMQEDAYDASSTTFLSGSDLNGWPVPPLRGSQWTAEDIVDYLGSGRNRFAAVGGEMKSVVENSTAYMTDDDLKAIAVYLKALPAAPAAAAPTKAGEPQATIAKLTSARDLAPGARLYLDNCGACHFVTGKGAERVFPALDGAAIVTAESPTGLIHTILAGAATPSTQRAPSVLPMPGFAQRLSDEDVAALATFVRGAWTNGAGAVTAGQVATIHKELPTP